VYDLGGGANSERGGVWGTDLGAVALPTENEWYKAAYYDSNKGGTDVGGYYQYSFGHANGDTISTSYANYDYSYENGAGGGTYALSPVDHYEGLNASLSAYGVADMTGNVWEWTDSQYNTFSRVVRGSAYYSDAADLAAGSSWLDLTPGDGYGDLGFRVASLAPIPEPSTYGMIGGALVGLLCLLRRKKRAVAP
jgi:formylglycine-generating enzyme required for sulfatase activity